MKPFKGGVNFFIQGYLHNVLVKLHKGSKTFYIRALHYRSLQKNESPQKIRLAISTKQPYDVLASSCTCVAGSLGFCNHVVGLMYLVSHYYLTKLNLFLMIWFVPPFSSSGISQERKVSHQNH